MLLSFKEEQSIEQTRLYTPDLVKKAKKFLQSIDELSEREIEVESMPELKELQQQN